MNVQDQSKTNGDKSNGTIDYTGDTNKSGSTIIDGDQYIYVEGELVKIADHVNIPPDTVGRHTVDFDSLPQNTQDAMRGRFVNNTNTPIKLVSKKWGSLDRLPPGYIAEHNGKAWTITPPQHML